MGAAVATMAMDRPAEASVSVTALFQQLVVRSTVVAVATPGEQRSVWEDGRILTYTRVHIDSAVAGDLAEGSEAWVRTLGGIVGDVGQLVEGEAVFSIGRPSLVFLEPAGAAAFAVSGRAQGQFGLVADASTSATLLRRSASVGHLVAAPSPASAAVFGADGLPVPEAAAASVLDGRPVDDAKRIIAATFRKAHAR
jgi:hypothetical protein